MWRKNRKPLRNNLFGVDLNRNFDLDWYNCCGSNDPSSDFYKGPHPFSEEETQTMMKFSRKYSWVKVLDFHSPAREIIVGYNKCTKMDEDIKKYIKEQGTELAKVTRYSVREPSGNGQHQSWQMKENTFYSFIIETHITFQPPYEFVKSEVDRVYPMILRALNESIPLQGHVKDSITKNPLKSEIIIKEIQFYANETRTSNSKYGYYHLYLPNGQYQIQFQSIGYKSKVFNIKIEKGKEIIQEVDLEKQ